MIDPDTQQPYVVSGPLKIGQERSELLDLVGLIAQTSQPKQLVFGPGGLLVQQAINLLQSKKSKKPEIDLSPEERAKIERHRLIKQQLQIFTNLYPQLVERNSIKYPIKDELLLKLPELHGCVGEQKPEPYKILVSADEFEKLIYIWEFCNNFNDYLDTPTFKLEELKCALQYTTKEDANSNLTIKEESELEQNEQMRVKHIREKGLHMINTLHTALVTCFLDDFFPGNSNDENTGGANTRSAAAAQQVQLVSAHGEKEDYILQAIDKLIENKDEVWPEITRLVLLHKVEHEGEDFGPNRATMDIVLQKLVGMRPCEYSQRLTFEEKVCLMTVMIDGIHDTDAFRRSLNDRIEEKSSFNKEKIEVYQAIRQLEQEQQELVKKHAESDFVKDEESINKELQDLYEKLKVATRVQSRELKDRISELESEKNHFLNENARLEEQIKKQQAHIIKLNEKLYKSSIKTTMLGLDAQRSEYWHFKDDCSRIYIRREEQPVRDVDMLSDEVPVEAARIEYSWHYYETEEQLNLLIERLNSKGIRERRLQESLRRVKDILKLKKTRKAKVNGEMSERSEHVPAEEASKPNEASKMDSEAPADVAEKSNEASVAIDESSASDRHVMFETDNYNNCMHTAVWFGKKIPGKRRMFCRGSGGFKSDVSEFGDNPVTLAECKSILVRIQNLYSENSKLHDREWTDKTERDQWTKQVYASKTCVEVTVLMKKLDEGMCQPFYLAQRAGNTQRLKLQMFKFWPNTELKDAWRAYVEDDNSLSRENLNSFYIILRILERITEQFVVRQEQKMEKKNKAAINEARSGPEAKAATVAASNQRGRQNQRDVNYVKYFQSSDSEEEEKPTKKDAKMKSESDQESESESEPEETVGGKSNVSSRQQRAMQRGAGKKPPAQKQKEPAKGRKRVVESESEDEAESEQYSEDEQSSEEEIKRPTRGRAAVPERQTRGRAARTRGRGRSQPESESEESEVSEEESSDDDGTSREWDEYCFICQDGGNVLCCESCNQVAHVSCLKLRSAPTGDWHCPDCLKKQTMTRLTRNQETKKEKNPKTVSNKTKGSAKPLKAKRRF